jgi:hypothetical protein
LPPLLPAPAKDGRAYAAGSPRAGVHDLGLGDDRGQRTPAAYAARACARIRPRIADGQAFGTKAIISSADAAGCSTIQGRTASSRQAGERRVGVD